MKRTTLISASLLLAFAGCTCGQGWRPNIFTRLNNRFHGVSNVGEPCDAGGCHSAPVAAPIASSGCDTCGTASASYGGYEGQVIDSYDGTPISSTYNGTINNGTIVGGSQTFAPSGQPPYQPVMSRMEPIAAKRAN
jgi:hypothetical protein